jgi:two-component system response regulator ChvI
MSLQKRRILVVDDDSDVGLSLKLILEAYGFEVVSFTDPETASESFTPFSYDLAILDIRMSGLSGFDLYKRLKSKDHNIKALFLTAVREFGEYDEFKDLVFPKMGERHFIQKPISDVGLLEQIYSILN